MKWMIEIVLGIYALLSTVFAFPVPLRVAYEHRSSTVNSPFDGSFQISIAWHEPALFVLH